MREQPDLVLMDINLPGFSGIEAVRRLAEAAPRVQAIVLTVVADESTVVEALTAGAAGYLLKDGPIDEMLAGIRAVAGGESLLSPRVARSLVRRLRMDATGSRPTRGRADGPRAPGPRPDGRGPRQRGDRCGAASSARAR